MLERESSEINFNPEKEQSKPEVIVEIGPGSMPITRSSELVQKRLESGANYIGVDLNKAELELLKDKRLSRKYLEKRATNLVNAHSSELPFKNKSVDSVWAINVFGSWSYIPEPNIKMRAKLAISEMSRVLNDDGEIVIGERIAARGPSNALDYLKKLDFDPLGLKASVYEGENLPVFLEEQGLPDHWAKKEFMYKGEPFFIVLRKLEVK